MKDRIFPMGKRYDTAVEIDKNFLKVSQVETSNKGSLVSKLIIEPISGLSDEDISNTLTEIIKSNNIRLDSLTAVIPRERAMVRYIRLPAVTPEEIDSMVSFEVTKQVPYSKEEIISDFKLISTSSEGYSEVMLVVVHKNEIDRIDNILAPTGKRPHRISLSSEAIASWLEFAVASEIVEAENICLLDVDADTTEIVVLSGGRLSFSRVASVGAAEIQQAEAEPLKWKERLLDETRRSIGMYIKEKGRDAEVISKFLVTGAISVIEDFSTFLQEEMKTPSECINVLSTLTLTDDALSEKGIPQSCSACAICGSLFISEGINLIPQEKRERQKVQLKLKRLIAVAVFVTAAISLLFAACAVNLYQKERLLARMNKALKQVEPVAEATGDKLKKLKVVKRQFSEGASSLDAIYHLYRLIPGNISLIDFDYDDESRAVRFRGTAARMSDVFKLATILEESGRFSNVQTRSVAKRHTRDEEIVDFQIICNFTEGRFSSTTTRAQETSLKGEKE